jgi:hypothetical protein
VGGFVETTDFLSPTMQGSDKKWHHGAILAKRSLPVRLLQKLGSFFLLPLIYIELFSTVT